MNDVDEKSDRKNGDKFYYLSKSPNNILPK